MTCGIYLLKFNNTDKVYVGKSKNIERRYKEHISINSYKSIKMKEAINKFGNPYLFILFVCSETDLNNHENYFISLYNSFIDGFNSVQYSQNIFTLKGEKHIQAIYPKAKYIEIFNLLVDSNLTYEDISSITNTKYSIVKSIGTLYSHKWLKEEYPDKYLQLENKNHRNSAGFKGITYPILYDNKGNNYTIENISKFARENGLDQAALTKVLNGKISNHKGWNISNNIKSYPAIISPEGIIYNIAYRKAKKFALDHNLCQSGLQKLLSRKTKEHNGWKLL